MVARPCMRSCRQNTAAILTTPFASQQHTSLSPAHPSAHHPLRTRHLPPSPPTAPLSLTRPSRLSKMPTKASPPAFLPPLALRAPAPRPSCLPARLRRPPRPLRRTRLSPTSVQTAEPPKRAKRAAAAKRPTASPRLAAAGDSLSGTPAQRALVAAFCTATAALPLKLAASAAGPADLALDAAAVAAAFVFSDFAVGVYHHAVDNYGSADTPLFGCTYPSRPSRPPAPPLVRFRTPLT